MKLEERRWSATTRSWPACGDPSSSDAQPRSESDDSRSEALPGNGAATSAFRAVQAQREIDGLAGVHDEILPFRGASTVATNPQPRAARLPARAAAAGGSGSMGWRLRSATSSGRVLSPPEALHGRHPSARSSVCT